ncbi:hypothetical protein NQK81_01590 [Amycolatopsis roodepoortensis]|uniref:hypothetical protein n=1 Tax=Amycolatopsis roodepoortensis TaxID=700274 RepID=UPI00214B7047|nr:hypothetical protein [Amycolatopsis roodepoortensis]UUV32168.1 hypothetical protein NQK81_01590 [Amycolatopsis roodepoortensis]
MSEDAACELDLNSERTVAALAAAVTAALEPGYTLIYIERDHRLPDQVVAAIVSGANPWETPDGDRLLDAMSSDALDAVHREVDELARKIVDGWEAEDDTDYSAVRDDWEFSDERETARDIVRDRDSSPWMEELVQRHGPVLLRVTIPAMDEDANLSFEPLSGERLLDLLGFEHTTANLTLAETVIAEASPEFSVIMGFAMVAVDLADIEALPADGEVELRNPYVWLGSAFTGTGWCSEEQFTGTVVVDRAALRTDGDAFGWSWSDVAGGTSARDFTGPALTARPATPVAA